MPSNHHIASLFHEMADLVLIKGGDPFRQRAFSNAAKSIEALPEPAETMLRRGTLERQAGIGEGTVHRIKQILRQGVPDDLKRMRQELPEGLREMLKIKGIGPRTIRVIWTNLRISTVPELEYAARSGALRALPRMGDRTIHKILRAIDDHKQRAGKTPYVVARRVGTDLLEQLRHHPAVQGITLGGSLRRGKAMIGDLDILVAADDGLAVTTAFETLPEVDRVLTRGSGRCSVLLHSRRQVDLRVLPPENWGAALHYFTGSALHNIAVRVRGLRYGIKISDKGLFVRDTDHRLSPAPREEDVFAAACLPWIPPELRENNGELEAAESGRLPRLVTADDLAGDLHMHTIASDGCGTASEMVEAAIALGHRYLAITDHTKTLSIANGLDEDRLAAQVRELRGLEDRYGVRVFAGTEVDILADGSLDLDLGLLRGLDWVIASVHSYLDMPGDQMTDRLITAMSTGVVDCLGHPTNRRLGSRSGADLDWERLLHAARRFDVAIEVNGNPYRMDLPDVACRHCREAGVPVAINTDAHAPSHLAHNLYGLVTARRGWLEPAHVLNTRPWTELRDRRSARFRALGVPVGASPKYHLSASPAPAPAAPVAERIDAGHWPEMPDEAPQTDGPTLAEQLAVRPLPSALWERVERYLRDAGDPELEQALEEVGPNAMQAAFGLLYS